MKTAAEIIEAISRLSPSERQEIEEYIHELIAKNWQLEEKATETTESNSAKD